MLVLCMYSMPVAISAGGRASLSDIYGHWRLPRTSAGPSAAKMRGNGHVAANVAPRLATRMLELKC